MIKGSEAANFIRDGKVASVLGFPMQALRFRSHLHKQRHNVETTVLHYFSTEVLPEEAQHRQTSMFTAQI